mmetsp:Transcript_18773/g.32865  ORF Transcript_18773/g.32865 Transcript_18773/m.32865 type:complete len:83 (-) Transcript_18773:320-568(-)
MKLFLLLPSTGGTAGEASSLELLTMKYIQSIGHSWGRPYSPKNNAVNHQKACPPPLGLCPENLKEKGNLGNFSLLSLHLVLY